MPSIDSLTVILTAALVVALAAIMTVALAVAMAVAWTDYSADCSITVVLMVHCRQLRL